MISTREIADDNSTISSTRWAFAVVIKFDIFMISMSIAVFCLFHFLKRPLDNSFFYAVATLLGVLTTLVVTPKALQGFEPKKEEPSKNIVEKEEFINDEEFISDNKGK
jgi:membrane protein YdbS with pleckstrin-like domain